MPQPLLVSGSMLLCAMGSAPAALTVLPTAQVLAEGAAAAVTTDLVSVQNIPSFGMCSSLSNPQVASATSAASGVLTPQSCVPNVPAPWRPGVPLVLVGGKPALNQTCTCQCAYGGAITVQVPTQRTVLG